MSTTVDDLRRENEELRTRLARAERIVSIFETSSEAIVSTATDGTILSWNAAAERLYGYTSGDAVGRSMLEIVPFALLAEHRDAFERATRGSPVAFETRRRRNDGSQIAVAVIYARMVDANGKLLGISTMAHSIVPT